MLSEQPTRTELLGAAMSLALINGLVARMSDAAGMHGLGSALSDLFGISIIVWAAAGAGVKLIWQPAGSEAVRLRDIVAIALFLPLIFLPAGASSWIALSGIALYSLFALPRTATAYQGAWILLAVAVPMFWSRAVFSLFADIVLPLDAMLASALLGTARHGNMVQFADQSDYFQIYPACSSLASISIAILCVVAFVRFCKRSWSLTDTGWCIVASLSVIGMNVLRLVLLGLYPKHFEAIHGPVGTAVLGAIMLVLVIGIGAFATRHVTLARA